MSTPSENPFPPPIGSPPQAAQMAAPVGQNAPRAAMAATPDTSVVTPNNETRVVGAVDRLLTHLLRPESDSEVAAPSVPAADLWIAEHLPDRFSIQVPLGSGTFGVVFSALDRRLRREVAVKVLRPEWMKNPGARKRFLRESHAAARLNHPHIVRVLESDENRLIAWQVCDLVVGNSLAEHLKCGPLPFDVATRLAWQIADALQYAHSKAVFHRDIKPDNILIDRPMGADLHGAQAYLIDFGLARILDEDLEQSRSGTIVGTPKYMAPECRLADPNIDRERADVYSLGIVLLECLVGPIANDSSLGIPQIHEQIQTQLQKLGSTIPGLPRDVEVICMSAAASAPADRYSSALALADDLHCFLNDQPIRARRRSPIEQVIVFSRQYRALVSLSVLLFVVMSCALNYVVQSNRTLMQQKRQVEQLGSEMSVAKDDAVTSALEAEQNRQQAIELQDRFRAMAWTSGMKEAFRYWSDGKPWHAQRELEQLKHVRADADSFTEWRLLRCEIDAVFQYPLEAGVPLTEVRGIPNREEVIVVAADGRGWIVNLLNGKTIRQFGPLSASPAALAINQQGTQVAIGGQTEGDVDLSYPKLYSLDKLDTAENLSGMSTTIESLKFSPDGTYLLAGPRYENPQLVHLPTATVHQLPGERRNVWLDYLEGSGQFVFQVSRQVVGFCDPSNPTEFEVWDLGEALNSHEIIHAVAIPKSDLLLVALANGYGTWLLDCKNRGVLSSLPQGEISRVRCTAHHPSLPIVAAGLENGQVLLWDYVFDGTQADVTLRTSYQLAPSPIVSLSLTPAHLVAATECGRLATQNLEAFTLPQSAAESCPPRAIDSPHFTPDGSWLVYMSNDLKIYCRAMKNRHTISNGSPHTPLENHEAATVDSVSRDRPIEFDDGLLQAEYQVSRRGNVLENGLGLTISDDGKLLAWAEDELSFAVFGEGKLRSYERSVALPNEPIRQHVLGFASQNELLVIEGERYCLQFYSLLSPNQPPWPVEMDGHTVCLATTAEGRFTYVAGRYAGVYELEYSNRSRRKILETRSEIEVMSLCKNDRILITGHANGTVQIHDLETGQTRVLPAHATMVKSLTISSDDRIGVSVDDRLHVAVWDLSAAALLGGWELTSNGLLEEFPFDAVIAFTPTGDELQLVRNTTNGPELRRWILRRE